MVHLRERSGRNMDSVEPVEGSIQREEVWIGTALGCSSQRNRKELGSYRGIPPSCKLVGAEPELRCTKTVESNLEEVRIRSAGEDCFGWPGVLRSWAGGLREPLVRCYCLALG